jgi:branched-chain amino acid transport system permease protein
VVNRLQNSRIGRAWIALREDEIACQAMGIDKTKTKLTAFALGATWAGMAGVVFAAKTTFINPASFTIWESIIILCVVVLGGMGSILGVIFGALVLILLPEYLRAFSEYRMLVFGAILVVMMVFRPGRHHQRNVRAPTNSKGLKPPTGPGTDNRDSMDEPILQVKN